MTLDSAVTYDRDKLTAAVETLATTIDQTPVDASVSAGQGGTFSVSPAKDGRAVDKAALLTALDQQLAALGTPASITMAVPVVPLAPAVATASAEAAKAAADRMAADVVVARGKDSWTIAGTSLAPLISFSTAADGSVTPVVDESGLDPLLKTLAKKVNQTVQDAGLKLVGGRIVATGTSREGRTLNAAGMKAAIVSEIGARQAGAAASPVAAVVKAVDPKLTTDGRQGVRPQDEGHQLVQRLLLGHRQQPLGREHRGAGHEDQRHGRAGRRKVRLLEGRRRPAQAPGHGPGNAIEGGKITVTGAFGGGICTTSTTLFNAAFRAGMVPLARQNHNEFINRYPAGLDATVWIVGNDQADHELQERHQVPDPDPADHHQRRQQAMAHVQDLERAERPDRHGHQHGHPAGRARDRHGREGSDQARGVPLLQQRRGGRRQGVDHRDDLRPRQAPLDASGTSRTTRRSTASPSWGPRPDAGLVSREASLPAAARRQPVTTALDPPRGDVPPMSRLVTPARPEVSLPPTLGQWLLSRPPHAQAQSRAEHTGGIWSGRRGSNSRPSAWEADALPTELLPLGRGRV